MKFRLLLLAGAAILAAHLGGPLWINVQAQDLQIIVPRREPSADVTPVPEGFGPPADTFPATSPTGIPAANREVLRIADLEAIALGNNPTIALARHRVDALQGTYLQVGLRPNPILGYQAEEMGDEGSAGQQGMFIGQRFITRGKLGLKRAVVSGRRKTYLGPDCSRVS